MHDFIKENAFFNQIMWCLILGFMPIVASIMLTWVHDPKVDGFHMFSTIMLFICSAIIIPLILAFFICDRNFMRYLFTPQFYKQWKVYFRGIKITNKVNISWIILYLARRLFLLCIIAEVVKIKTLQIILVHFLNLAFLMFIAWNKPFQFRLLNYLVIWDECLIFMCTCHLNLFTEYVPDFEMRHELGISLIVFMNLHVWVHLLFVLYSLLRAYRLAYVNYVGQLIKVFPEHQWLKFLL